VDQSTSDLSCVIFQASHYKWLDIFLEALAVVTLTQLAKVVHASCQDLVLIGHEECVLATSCYIDHLDLPRHEVTDYGWWIQVKCVVRGST
jgi:hypothetical protein